MVESPPRPLTGGARFFIMCSVLVRDTWCERRFSLDERWFKVNVEKLIASREKSVAQIEAQLKDYDERIEQLGDRGQRIQLRNIASTWRSRLVKLQEELVALRALARIPCTSSKQMDLEELTGAPKDPPGPGPVMGKGKPPAR